MPYPLSCVQVFMLNLSRSTASDADKIAMNISWIMLLLKTFKECSRSLENSFRVLSYT